MHSTRIFESGLSIPFPVGLYHHRNQIPCLEPDKPVGNKETPLRRIDMVTTAPAY